VTQDGARIVTGSEDKTMRVWNAETGAELFEFGHGGAVVGVATAHDGNRIATASSDQTVRVWSSDGLPERKPSDAELRSYAEDAVSSCLDIRDRGSPFDRSSLFLRPEPPDWCIRKRKPPYDTPAWRDRLAGKEAQDAKIAGKFGDFADRALYSGDFPQALRAVDLGLEFDPSLTWINVNRAHAYMFLGRLDDALDLHRRYRGKQTPIVRDVTWEKAVEEDFAKLRAAGLRAILREGDTERDLMKIIEAELAKPPPSPQ
jgi:hypothetical protein